MTYDDHERWQQEWALWEQYQAGMNALHAKYTMDQQPKGCGYVYAIEMFPTGDPFGYAPDEMYKIGRSINPDLRFKEINRSSVKMPYKLRLSFQWWARDAHATERLLHTMFTRFRVDGEWFRIPHEYTNVFHDIWYFGGSPDEPSEGIIAYNTYVGGYLPVIEFFQKRMDDNERIRQRREAQSE